MSGEVCIYMHVCIYVCMYVHTSMCAVMYMYACTNQILCHKYAITTTTTTTTTVTFKYHQ